MEFDAFVAHLESKGRFKRFQKRPIKYKLSDQTLPFTFNIVEKKTTIVTVIDGEKETENIARAGDVIITGGAGEQYVMSFKKFLDLYNVNNSVAVPRPIERIAAKVTLTDFKQLMLGDQISFTAPWGEAMILKPGDYLVMEGKGKYYRVETKAFQRTYKGV